MEPYSRKMAEAKKAFELGDKQGYLRIRRDVLDNKILPYNVFKFFNYDNEKKDNKKLTVVTINFNNLKGLRRTVKSVVHQSKRNEIEFVVVDGGSDDGSLEYLDEHKDLFDICVYGKDRGIYHAMNRGLSLAGGDFLIYMNSGDVFFSKDTVSKFINTGSQKSGDIFYGSTQWSDGNVWKPHDYKNMWKGMFCSHQSIFVRTKLLTKYRFNEKNSVAADFEQIYKIYLSGARFKKLDFVVSRPEDIGASADFYKRTLERWQVVRGISNPQVSVCEIDKFYSAFIQSEGVWNGAHGFHGDEAFSSLDPNSEKRTIFLISMPRSGSTLFQKILEKSPHVSSAGEPWVMLPLLSMYDDTYVDAKYGQKLNIIAKDEFEKEIGDTDLINKAQKNYAATIYTNALRKNNTRYFLDKTPRYIYIVEKLSEIFPKAKFIILLRNPAAIASSYASTWFGNDYNKLINDPYCRYDFEHGFCKLANFLKSSFNNKIIVRYEELVSNPEKEMKRVFDYLDIPFLDTFINYNNADKEIKKYRMGDPSSVYDKTRPDVSGKDKWVDTIPHDERDRFSKLMSLIGTDTIDQLGYNYDAICKALEINSNADALKSFLTPFIRQFGDFNSFDSSKNLISNDKKLGVLITSYNNSESIELSMLSVIHQSKRPDIIVVADDSSTDNSIDIINKVKEKYRDLDIKIISRQENVGVAKNRDLAIRGMDCDYITTLDGDDYFYPAKLEAEFLALNNRNDRVAFSDIIVWGATNTFKQDTSQYNKIEVSSSLKMLISRSAPVPRDMMFPKEIYLNASGFDHDLCIYEDWAFKMRLLYACGDFNWVHSKHIGTIYDRRNPGLSGKPGVEHATGQLRVIARNENIFDEYPDFLSDGLQTVSRHLSDDVAQLSIMEDLLGEIRSNVEARAKFFIKLKNACAKDSFCLQDLA